MPIHNIAHRYTMCIYIRSYYLPVFLLMMVICIVLPSHYCPFMTSTQYTLMRCVIINTCSVLNTSPQCMLASVQPSKWQPSKFS